MFVNGVSVGLNNSGSVLASSVLNKLSFSRGNDTLNFLGDIKQLQVYKTSLNDAELIALTS